MRVITAFNNLWDSPDVNVIKAELQPDRAIPGVALHRPRGLCEQAFSACHRAGGVVWTERGKDSAEPGPSAPRS